MKFKVGQKVRVTNNPAPQAGISFVPLMDHLKGKIVEVDRYDGFGHVRIKESTFSFVEEWLEEIKENKVKEKFWMVLGGGNPSHRHISKSRAEREAERLARSNPGQEFVVLEALKAVKINDIEWTELEDVPF